MHQCKYVRELLGIFEMNDCNTIINTSEINPYLDECRDEEIMDAIMYK